MAVIQITRSIEDTGEFSQQATLDGVTYTLKFRWNVRYAAWEMGVYDAEATTAHQVGIVLRDNWPAGAYTPGRIPSGIFMAFDTGAPLGDGTDPGFDDLGNRVQLEYWSLSDLA